jgi:hypothetical protein
MTEPKRIEIDGLSSTEHSVKDTEAQRNKSVYSTSGRKVSEWEALQIVAAGDLQTINAEIDAIEVDLQAVNMRSTWYKPLLKFNDPKYFTWLLVGKFLHSNLGPSADTRKALHPWADFFQVLISP